MKAVAIFVLAGVAGAFAYEQIWLDFMSAMIEEAEAKVDANKTIPELATDLGLNTLVDLVTKAGLGDALSGEGPFTVFGPTDKAFSRIPKKVIDYLLKNTTVLAYLLKYHVASGNVQSQNLSNDQLVPSLVEKNIRINIYKTKKGEVITAQGRPVTLADQEASNGVIHEVDGILIPPAGTLAFVASKCPAFSTLYTAVSKVPDIAKTLDGDGPLTLFAPSNRAFKRIPEKCLDALLKNTTLLTKVLTYHVVPSTAYSAGLSCGDEVKTVEGENVKITKLFGRLRVNHSRVTYADGSVSNGVMHVIDRVLFPSGFDDFCDDAYADYDDDSHGNDDLIFKSLFFN